MEFKGNAGEITPGSICHLNVRPSSNKNVKVVTSGTRENDFAFVVSGELYVVTKYRLLIWSKVALISVIRS